MRSMNIIGLALAFLSFNMPAEARGRAVAPSPMEILRMPRVTTNASVSAGGCTMSTGVWPINSTNSSESYFLFGCPSVTWGLLARNTDKGLQVGPVFMQDPKGTIHMILKSANLAELFVPYHTGNARLSDMQFCTSGLCTRAVDANDLGSNSLLATIGTAPYPTAVAEIRDRGIAWMCKWAPNNIGPGSSHSYRGKEMVIWSTWDPGNYDYVIEYSFRDDGQMSFRIGATGWDNNTIGTSGGFGSDANVGHMHNALWRVDIGINGGVNNSALVTYHDENALPAFDSELPFNGGFEGAMDLDPKRFATLLITDAATNAAGHQVGYELQPVKQGLARHYGPGEGWSLHDTWVTRYNAGEETTALGTNAGYHVPDDYLLGNSGNQAGVFNHESVINQDIVVWHISSSHHDPHDEDQTTQANDPLFLHKGITLTHWSGFDLVPHNFFDANPLGAPYRANCDGGP